MLDDLTGINSGRLPFPFFLPKENEDFFSLWGIFPLFHYVLGWGGVSPLLKKFVCFNFFQLDGGLFSYSLFGLDGLSLLLSWLEFWIDFFFR